MPLWGTNAIFVLTRMSSKPELSLRELRPPKPPRGLITGGRGLSPAPVVYRLFFRVRQEFLAGEVDLAVRLDGDHAHQDLVADLHFVFDLFDPVVGQAADVH